MVPTIEPGDIVAIAPAADALPEPGTLVLVRDPEEPSRTLIKRVGSRGQDTFAVSSDCPTEGRDSRHFGSLRREHLLGIVRASWSRRRFFRMVGTG